MCLSGIFSLLILASLCVFLLLVVYRLNRWTFYWGDVQHSPYVYSAKLWAELERQFSNELEQTRRARLRGLGRGIVSNNLYFWYSWQQVRGTARVKYLLQR